MLVRDPEKRYTIAMIKRHRWMQAEVPPETPEGCPSRSMNHPEATNYEKEAAANVDKENEDQGLSGNSVRSGKKCDVPINEGLMRVMADRIEAMNARTLEPSSASL